MKTVVIGGIDKRGRVKGSAWKQETSSTVVRLKEGADLRQVTLSGAANGGAHLDSGDKGSKSSNTMVVFRNPGCRSTDDTLVVRGEGKQEREKKRKKKIIERRKKRRMRNTSTNALSKRRGKIEQGERDVGVHPQEGYGKTQFSIHHSIIILLHPLIHIYRLKQIQILI